MTERRGGSSPFPPVVFEAPLPNGDKVCVVRWKRLALAALGGPEDFDDHVQYNVEVWRKTRRRKEPYDATRIADVANGAVVPYNPVGDADARALVDATASEIIGAVAADQVHES